MPVADSNRITAGRKLATVAIAAATATALTVGAAPPRATTGDTRRPDVTVALASVVSSLSGGLARTTSGSPGLPPMELAPGAPDPSSIPDLTDGLGPEDYELLQALAAGLEADTVHELGLSGLLADLGYDPTRSVNTALGALLTQALTGITIDLSGVPVLGDAFAAAGIDNVAALATLLGLNLGDPFNLAGLPASGINTITVGSASTLLDALGVDLGSVPAFPNSVADEINGTPYVDVAALPIVNSLLAAIPVTVRNLPTITELKVIQTTLNTTGDVNIVDLRIPVVIGTGLGAFAAGMAYPQVLAELPNQPEQPLCHRP
jgi:hypothetical protein